MWDTMVEQLKQDREENEKAIAQVKAQMAPFQDTILRLEREIRRINELLAWAEAQRRDSAAFGKEGSQ